MGRFKFCLLLLLLPYKLLAQSFTPDPDWRFENFNSQNHFINDEILDLATDKYGYMWSCSRGVQRFDGYKTTFFNSFDETKGTIRTNNTDVITDNNGRIWVNSSGLCYYDDASNRFVYIKNDAKHTILYVNSFFVQKNYLWFVCNYGLAKIDVNTLQVTYTALNEVVNPLGVFLLDDNTLLVSSREKTYTYNIQKNTYAANTLLYKGSLLKVFSLVKNGAATFIGTNHGLFIYRNLYDVSLATPAIQDIETDDLLFLPQDKEKKYLFIAADERGVIVYNTRSKKIEFDYLHDDNNPYSLPSNIISKFLVDKKQRVWMSTALGISMLDISNQQWKTRYINQRNTDGLYISKIARDKYDSTKVWMSSYSQEMICMNWKTKKIESTYHIGQDIQKLIDFEQIAKNKWLLITQQYIIEWSPQQGILAKKSLPETDVSQLAYYIHKIIMADANTCYITTNLGLFKYDLLTHNITLVAEKDPAKKGDDLSYDLINGFYDDGVLWIGSKDGLFSYNTATRSSAIYKGKGNNADYYFFHIAKAPNNQIVCASGDGIAIFNTQTKAFSIVNKLANFNKPDCESIVAINNTAWINTDAGILNYDLATHSSEKAVYETPLTPIFPGSPFAIVGNDIILGFRNGFVYFTPGLKNASVPSDPVIESVHVNNKLVLPQYPTCQNTGNLTFSHTNNAVNIAFTAFLYTDPDHIKFRYRLKGAEPAWQYTTDQRSANYAQLPPGNYTFYVQTGNKNGVWNSHQAAFNFIITPPYWETWWFRVLVTLAVALILYRLYRYKIDHILAIEKIRERIASDFHDDIGSALSSISIFSEVADKQLQQQSPPEDTRAIISHISSQSRAMLDAMDDIIWAVNPKNDHFNDLAIRMREFAIPLLEAKNIKFDISISEDILNTRLKMEARKNLFLVFKEAINNILKHADCTVMKVTVSKQNSQLELIINDNGKGFDIDAPHIRNGLKNMHKRAAEIGGTLNITSQQGAGTTITLLLNII
ncbi:triple tyrosine motif-containing protein [Mucilaginibacter sp. dw_454]|uniref:sensor histidine kinase n=1 Tax=Mucilaginibacter sp. dw_454 TaxID=2720079 RepID=UPI001BD39540|nr:triple tyrosine motif-containing protein [Mucilaginibacter sp. dw_454]